MNTCRTCGAWTIQFNAAARLDELEAAVRDYIYKHDKDLSGEVSMRSAYAMGRLRTLVPIKEPKP